MVADTAAMVMSWGSRRRDGHGVAGGCVVLGLRVRSVEGRA
jgi:hypothetical protein